MSGVRWFLWLCAVGMLGVPNAHAAPPSAPAPARVYAKMRYADSLLSVNDRCPVRGGVLARNIRPVYVNREPVGFC